MPKSSSPKKDSPKKGSKSGSPKKGGDKKGLPKWSVEDCIKAEQTTFDRVRYETPMDPSYKRVSLHIALIVRKIHLFEVYNEVPEVPQFCNSNKGKGSPKSKASPKSKDSPKGKGSPKGKKGVEEDKPPPPEYEAPILEGVVAIRRGLLMRKDEKLFVEVTATWKYAEDSKVTPYPPQIRVQHQCYRDYYYLFPVNYDRFIAPTPYNQTLVKKIRKEYGSEWEGFPFIFNLAGCPNSINFNRPYNYEEPINGLFWSLRCFIGKYEFTKPNPERECRMTFYKFTIAPSLLTITLRKSSPYRYIRYKTLEDIGDLFLSASLDRDLYYHGDEISVTINIENNSQRHVIESITVFFEQNYRFFHEIPHDNSIPLGEVWLKSGDGGLPINPKSKNFTKTVQIKPLFDWSKYNLVTDGKMFRDEKIFLASTTIIMKNVLLTPEEIAEKEASGGDGKKAKSSPDKKGSPKSKDSPKKGGKKSPKSDKKSPPKEEEEKPQETDENPELREPEKPPTKRILTNRNICHSVFISYDIVVRCNLRTPVDPEAGHPQVRVPFILTRETRYINEWTNPPSWNHPPMKCDTVHTTTSQPHAFCRKYKEIEAYSEEKDKNSPKSKGSPKSKDKTKSKGSPKSKGSKKS